MEMNALSRTEDKGVAPLSPGGDSPPPELKRASSSSLAKMYDEARTGVRLVRESSRHAVTSSLSSIGSAGSIARGHSPAGCSAPDFSERCTHGAIYVGGILLLVGCVALWAFMFIYPVHWWAVGRYSVQNSWTPVPCTVLEQTCSKECSGCGCPDSCCPDGVPGCIRSFYFLSQTCVWLSMSKYEQLEDFGAKVNVDITKNAGLRRGVSPWLAFSGLAVASGALGLFQFRMGTAGFAAVALALSHMAVPVAAYKGCRCHIKHHILMTVSYKNVTVTKTVDCHAGDDREFCGSDALKFRDKSCRTLEDMEREPHCKEEHLNRVGTEHRCYQNPADPSELEINGAKGHGLGTIWLFVGWFLLSVFGVWVWRGGNPSAEFQRHVNNHVRKDRIRI